jgi:hypothetical protein
MNKLSRFLTLLKLDIKTLPCHFMNRKTSAQWHLKYICPHCPDWRRKMRDVTNNGNCWWHENWQRKNYSINPHFGALNWLRQYFGYPIDLKKWQKK